MTAHGLRSIIISMLSSAGYSDASVVLLTGRRDTSSMQSNHNLRGGEGKNQLCAVFGGNGQSVHPPKPGRVLERVQLQGTDHPEKRARTHESVLGGMQATNCTFHVNIRRD